MDGNVIGVLGMSKDISDELRMAEEHSAQFYARSLIEATLDPCVTISPAGKITDVNQASELVTGLARERLIGTDFCDYFTAPEKARQGYERVFSEGLVRDYELAIRHVGGAITDVLYNASVYRDDQNRVLGVFAAARDVTERKRFKQSLLKANRMKSEFLAGMSHELRTPLNAIIGFTEFLVDEKPGPVTPKQKEYLNDVLNSAGHLLQLINDVLDLARIEAGKLELRREIFSLGKAVQEVSAVMKGSAAKSALRSPRMWAKGSARFFSISRNSSRCFTTCYPTPSSLRTRKAGLTLRFAVSNTSGWNCAFAIPALASGRGTWAGFFWTSSSWTRALRGGLKAPDWDWRSPGKLWSSRAAVLAS